MISRVVCCLLRGKNIFFRCNCLAYPECFGDWFDVQESFGTQPVADEAHLAHRVGRGQCCDDEVRKLISRVKQLCRPIKPQSSRLCSGVLA